MLNKKKPDIKNLKVFILGTPKTGNTWLRWLFHYMYKIPVIEIPSEFNQNFFSNLPNSFVTHQHLPPSKELYLWLIQNNAVVLSPIRHPADTFISFFNFNKWNTDQKDETAIAMANESLLGDKSFHYLRTVFPQLYSLSLAWVSLGAFVVRYEDLLTDPIQQLTDLSRKILPIDDKFIRIAILSTDPAALARAGVVDSRHFRTAKAGSWMNELPDIFIEEMRKMEPFSSACEIYSYSWDKSLQSPLKYDLKQINPFKNINYFDNGQFIGPSLPILYLSINESAVRWPQPQLTKGDSFWTWLISPYQGAKQDDSYSPSTLTNLMMIIRDSRYDLQEAFHDPIHADRISFLSWFLDRALNEYELPWGLISPAQEAYCAYLIEESKIDPKLPS